MFLLLDNLTMKYKGIFVREMSEKSIFQIWQTPCNSFCSATNACWDYIELYFSDFPCVLNFESKERRFAPLEPLKLG